MSSSRLMNIAAATNPVAGAPLDPDGNLTMRDLYFLNKIPSPYIAAAEMAATLQGDSHPPRVAREVLAY
ncbi:hypothetical protein Pan216_21000 [Planctomycetes bacterium Pan216]|uniref:Uncharacterized protein n=1 Tax=Kolteria novifilia TaxID=2527975 RepID=A0A518B2T6_9BACT|nr:hypothetical protein Pan216_21000 [Planctomycetes bacterium Pan216]